MIRIVKYGRERGASGIFIAIEEERGDISSMWHDFPADRLVPQCENTLRAIRRKRNSRSACTYTYIYIYGETLERDRDVEYCVVWGLADRGSTLLSYHGMLSVSVPVPNDPMGIFDARGIEKLFEKRVNLNRNEEEKKKKKEKYEREIVGYDFTHLRTNCHCYSFVYLLSASSRFRVDMCART